jgi:hypothetical protein
MSSILNLLKTKKGTEALKQKLLTLPAAQQKTKNVQVLLQSVYRAERKFQEIEQRGSHFNRAIKVIKELEITYPDTFDFENPKPLKSQIGIDVIADTGHIPETKVYQAIKYYKARECYQDCIIAGEYTIDLNGDEYEEIVTEKKLKAQKRMTDIIGRIAAIGKFGGKLSWHNDMKAPNAIIEGVKLYYQENITAELNIVAAEAYGRSAYPKVSYEVSGSNYIATCHILHSELVVIGAGFTKAEAKECACLNMLSLMQQQGIAYPFECVEKEDLPEPEVIEEPPTDTSAHPQPQTETDAHSDYPEAAPLPKPKLTSQPKISVMAKKIIAARQAAPIAEPKNSQEKLYNMLIKNGKCAPVYTVEKIMGELPYEFEATCEIPEFDLSIIVSEGSPRKAKEEAAERLLWEIDALKLFP